MKQDLENKERRRREHKLFGRPRLAAEDRRDVKIAVFLSLSEEEIVREKCRETYLSLPEFMRRAALNRQVENRKSDFDAEALSELRRCGQNLNQLVRELSLARKVNLEIDFDKVENIAEQQLLILNKLSRKIIEE